MKEREREREREGTVLFMEWSHGMESLSAAMVWHVGVEVWSGIYSDVDLFVVHPNDKVQCIF